MDGRRRKTVHAARRPEERPEGRQPLVDVHGVHGRDAHVAIVRRPHVRAIGHANRAYEVFRRYRLRRILSPVSLTLIRHASTARQFQG